MAYKSLLHGGKMATIKSKSTKSTKKIKDEEDENTTDAQKDDVKTKSSDSSEEEPDTNGVSQETKQDDSDQNKTKDSEESEDEDESNSQDIDWKAQARKWEKLAKKNLKNAKTDNTDATDDAEKADEEESDAKEESDQAVNDDTKTMEDTSDSVDGEQSTDESSIEEQLADLKNKYESLIAEKEHSALVQQIADQTGLSAEVIAMLSGEDADSLLEQAKKLAQLMKIPSSNIVGTDGSQPLSSTKPASNAEIFGQIVESMLNQ